MIILIPLMFGAVSGSPVSQAPLDPPTVWFEAGNDNFLSVGKDDQRTAGFGAGLRLGSFEVGAGYDLMTDIKSGTRSDELTVTAGWVTQFPSVELSIAAGARIADDLGGETAQRKWHHITAAEEVNLNYEEREVRPVIITDARWFLRVDPEYAFDATVSALGSYDIGQIDVQARVLFGDNGIIAVGPRWVSYVGALSSSAAFYQGNADGLGLAIALRMQYLTLRWEMSFTGSMYGLIGVVF